MLLPQPAGLNNKDMECFLVHRQNQNLLLWMDVCAHMHMYACALPVGFIIRPTGKGNLFLPAHHHAKKQQNKMFHTFKDK